MSKLIVSYRGSKYYKNGWVIGSVKILEVLEEDDEYEFKIGSLLNIRGTTSFEPTINCEYKLIGELQKDKKWGTQLEILSMNEKISLKTDEDKKYFLKQILTENQVNELYATYEDPFLLLENEDIESLIKVNGIGDIMANKLISRFNSTIDNAPAYVYFKKLDITNNLVKKLISVYGGAAELIRAFEENPYILIDDVDGIGFIKADEIALKYGLEDNSPLRIREGISYILNKEAQDEGCTWISPTYFKNEIVKLLKIKFDDIKETFKDMRDNDVLYISDDKSKIALKKYYNLEENIANKLKIMINNDIKQYDNEEIISNKIKDLEIAQGFEYTDEQALGIITSMNNGVCIITGGGGTGKTSVVKGIIGVLSADSNIIQTSFSGQAAKRMKDVTGYPSSTIHRLLGYIPGKGFSYDENNKLPYNVIILDECSMVPIDLFWNLIRAIKDDAKLIILGDNKQLPPVGIGNLFTDLLNSDIVPKQILTKIHRQAAKSAIITTSTDIRNRKQIVDVNENGEKILGELQDLILCSYQNKSKIFNRAMDAFKDEFKNNPSIRDIQVIVPMKEKGDLSQNAFNNEIQKFVNPQNDRFVKLGEKLTIKEGDKIINRKNNYKLFDINYQPVSVFNGSMGIVKKIYDDYMIIDFFDIGEVRITSDLYRGLQLGYSITCHSCIPEETMLYTNQGIKTIGELNNGAKEGCFEPIVEGIKVFNGLYFEKPKSFYNNGIDKTFDVSTKLNYNIRATENHKFNIFNENGFDKKPLKDLRNGEYLILNKNINHYGNIINIPNGYYDIDFKKGSVIYSLPKTLTPQLSRILGCLVADGTINKKLSLIRFVKKNKSYMDILQKDIKNVFNYDAKIKKYNYEDAYFLEINSVCITRFINNFEGVRPNNKFVPNLILSTTKDNQCAFLMGLFEDGTANIKKEFLDHIELSQKNEKCICQIRNMLLNMGIICSYKRRKKGVNYSHHIYIYKEYAKIFFKDIGFMSSYKNNREKFDDSKKQCSKRYIPFVNRLIIPLKEKTGIKYISNLNESIKRNLYTDDSVYKLLCLFEKYSLCKEKEYIELKYIYDNFYFDKITSIEYYGEEQTYCLEMEETHNFVQNGLILGNSQGGQWPTTIVAFDNSAYILLSSELAYTAVTRASKKCYLITETKALRYATTTTKIKGRDTFLKDLLKEIG